jgi:D-glyceraldehyde dehydrogenase (NADP+)
MESASNHVAKLLLELGGKAPLIIWNDADLSWAVKCAIWARFWNCGQTCISSERMYLDEKISDRFLARFAKAAKTLRIGNPISSDTDLGPMVSADARDSTAKFVEKAREEGDRIMIGGKVPQNPRRGYYYEPTIVTDVDQGSDLVQEEIFGPVIPVLEVDSFDKAIEYSNDSQYGLASYIFTRDANRIMKSMYELKFGECYINQIGPEQLQGAHTGFRQTGVGVEGSKYGVEHYTQLKTSYIGWDDRPQISYLFPYGRKGSS